MARNLYKIYFQQTHFLETNLITYVKKEKMKKIVSKIVVCPHYYMKT